MPPSTNYHPAHTVYFWRPTDPHGYLGQWYSSPITAPLLTFTHHTHPGLHPPLTYQSPTHTNPNCTCPLPRAYTFTCAEQYMMAHKSHLLAPHHPTFHLILENTDPAAQRALGRSIPNFSDEVWESHRFEIVKWGNYHKFTQNPELKRMLLETGERELVEASPRDRVWGVGYGAVNAPANRARWGKNLLGKALMEVRDWIRREEAIKKERRLAAEEESKLKHARDAYIARVTGG